MILNIPAPRLLPVTIGMMTLVLAAKSVSLVRSAISETPAAPFIAAAWAGAHEGGEKKPEHGAEKKPEHGEKKPEGKGEAKKEGKGEEKKAEEAPPPPEEPPVPPGPPPVSESEKAVLLELRQRREELEAREAAIASRESVAAAAEQKLSSRVDELQALQKKLEGLDAGRKDQEDHAWVGLVKVYETMKPREAAAIFNDLAMPVMIAVLDRMKEAKAAAILAAMAPDKAREVTTQLALSRTRAAAAVETTAKPAQPAEPARAGGPPRT